MTLDDSSCLKTKKWIQSFRQILQDEKNCTFTNTDGWGNKLVTIFARHLDNFILTNNFSLICQIRDFGSGQILQPGQLYISPGFAKIAPWRLARRDRFVAKVPGLEPDGLTPPTFTPSTAGPLALTNRCNEINSLTFVVSLHYN